MGIVAVAVLALLALGSTVGALLLPDSQSTAVASTGSTSTVRRGTVALTASAAGTVQAATTRGLSFSMNGTVTELNVKTGDSVTAGQVLAKIDDTDAQNAVDAAQTDVNSAQDALTAAQVTATATPATGACQNATTDYVSPSPATDDSPRPSSSAASPAGSPPASQHNGGGSAGGTGSAGGSGACGTASGGSGATGSGSGRGGSADSLLSAQQQLNDAQLALVQAQQKLAGTVITAPVAGTVLSVSGTAGAAETVSGTGFIVLSGVDDTQVTAYFTETDVAHLAVGQTTSITLPDRSGQTYTGKVSQVSLVGTADNQLVRYGVMVAFDQAPSGLLFGQSANVVVTVSSVANVLYVPSSAVTDIHNGSGTVAVRTGGHDERRTVGVGLRSDQYTEVTSGLNQGDTVLASGQ
jgi:multidrug efflux pump subunit AcrA (membrane-fusion protein)